MVWCVKGDQGAFKGLDNIGLSFGCSNHLGKHGSISLLNVHFGVLFLRSVSFRSCVWRAQMSLKELKVGLFS